MGICDNPRSVPIPSRVLPSEYIPYLKRTYRRSEIFENCAGGAGIYIYKGQCFPFQSRPMISGKSVSKSTHSKALLPSNREPRDNSLDDCAICYEKLKVSVTTGEVGARCDIHSAISRTHN